MKEAKTHKHTNALINESSPYLLQHAHNPVDWYPWGKEALQKAQEENKLLLVSIGYSACHWCHVMEKESFEDEEVAAYMNKHFVCIKVDREERPDVDQIYMNAVQLITGSGGWPLNSFALADGRPFYGGTYFPKKNWLYLLKNIVSEYEKDSAKVVEYADNLVNGIKNSELISKNDEEVNYKELLSEMIGNWKVNFDNIEGGPNRAPKFPLPNNYEFLLDYGILSKDAEILSHVELSLDKMAMGGIYDQLGGGFARYSTDLYWKVPHFEKMLYDNAQLISLYSKAYRFFKKDRYLEIVKESLAFIERELTGPKGEFYSALDADSEGEEGKFYVWTKEEIENTAGVNSELIESFYNIKPSQTWEGNYILFEKDSRENIAKRLDMDLKTFNSELSKSKELLFEERKNRIHPGLDDKSLTSWNALMISAYCNAYRADANSDYQAAAEKNAKLIWSELHQDDGMLLHNYKNGKVSIDGFLEDYALTAQAFVDLYQINFEPVWLKRAEELTIYAIKHFQDDKTKMFYFTSDEQHDLVARKMEINDNVIPASNSIMANVLFQLGQMLEHLDWVEDSKQMLQNISPHVTKYGSSYSNWGKLMLEESYRFHEIAISGKKYRELWKEMNASYLPNTLFVASGTDSDLPLLQNKFVRDKTLIYVCVNKACQLPVEKTKEALLQIK